MRLAAACILAAFIACFQSAAAIEIPDTATVLPGYASRIDAMRRILDGTTDNLTGLWNYPEEQMVVAIRKSAYCRRGGKRSHRLRHRNRLSDHNGKQIKDADVALLCGRR